MYRVYACLFEEHDLRLVVVAGLVCLLASGTALSLARRGLSGQGRTMMTWLAIAAVVAGCGVWATHFIAMLAFDIGLPVHYDPAPTVLSVVVAVAGVGASLVLAAQPGRRSRWLGGACIGASVGAMHFTGMVALQVPAFKHWDPALVGAALLLSVSLCATAARVTLDGSSRASLAGGTLLLCAGICGLHFISMGALQLEPTPLLPAPQESLSRWWLALAVASATAVILGAAAAGMLVDRQFAGRAAREAHRLRALVDATFEGIIIHAGGTVLDTNASLLELLRRDRAEVVGCSVAELFSAESGSRVTSYLDSARASAFEAELKRRDRRLVPVELLGRPIEYNGEPAQVIAVRDVSERRAAERRIHHLAYHDALTGLPNRVLFREHLHASLLGVRRRSSLAVLCLDLDRFKSVNDTLGHPVGDGLLQAVAERLRASVRRDDLVARLGGDEFAIVQEGALQPDETTSLCRRLVDALSAPFEINGHQIVIGTSVGVVLADNANLDPDTLMKSADLALYRAKAEGGGTWRFFEKEMDARMQARRMLELDLRQALPLGQFVLFYQPIVDATDNSVSGFEALVRWQHPERGTVSPGVFIPVAEEIGLIGQIGNWVLRQACCDAAAWPGHLSVAVNLSPVQFRNPALARDVSQALADAGLPASRLELEVTESLLLDDDENVLDLLHELRALGIRIAMDDFGTGYSSLSYLRRFPFDKIKIDQSFVRGMGQQEDCAAIVRAVVGLGRSLGMAVNAEGVETEEQMAALRAEGCGEVQGYLFSEPRPVSELARLLALGTAPWTQATPVQCAA